MTAFCGHIKLTLHVTTVVKCGHLSLELDRSHAEEVQQQYHQAVFNLYRDWRRPKNRPTWKRTVEEMGKLKDNLDRNGEQGSRSCGIVGEGSGVHLTLR